MPELPEVETVRRGLIPALEGQRLTRVEARRPDLRFPFPEGFVQRLTGATLTRLERRAKYLWAFTDRDDVLVMHLGMTGRFEIEGSIPGAFAHAVPPDQKHAHVLFETAGAKVTYYDPRRFGFMGLVAQEAIPTHPWFAGLGPEPLGPTTSTVQHLAEGRLRRAQAGAQDAAAGPEASWRAWATSMSARRCTAATSHP